MLAIAEAWAQSEPPKTPAAPGTKLAEEEFKNIQALKGIPAEQVIPSMQFIATSLGVECEYCHVAHANEKDDKKPKVTARKMIDMMMAINKDNFEGHREVTCYSCYRGSTEPVGTPVITDEELRPADGEGKKSGEAKGSLPAADQLLDKYLAAIGGADALQKITSRVQKGTLTAFGGQHFPADVYSKAPDKRVSVMHLQGGDSVTAFDGKRGWLSVPGRVHRMSAAENDAARIDADLYLPAHLKMLYSKFSVDTGEKIDGRDTYLVSVAAVYFFTGIHAEFRVEHLQVCRQVKIRIDSRSVIFRCRHPMHTPGNTEPSPFPIKRRDAVPALQMHDRDPLVRSLRIYIGRKMLPAEGGERSLLHAACDFLQRIRAADGRKIFVQKLVRSR